MIILLFTPLYKISTLDLRCIDAVVLFISSLISGTVNANEALASIWLHVPTYQTKITYFLYSMLYGNNRPIYRVLRH